MSTRRIEAEEDAFWYEGVEEQDEGEEPAAPPKRLHGKLYKPSGHFLLPVTPCKRVCLGTSSLPMTSPMTQLDAPEPRLRVGGPSAFRDGRDGQPGAADRCGLQAGPPARGSLAAWGPWSGPIGSLGDRWYGAHDLSWTSWNAELLGTPHIVCSAGPHPLQLACRICRIPESYTYSLSFESNQGNFALGSSFRITRLLRN